MDIILLPVTPNIATSCLAVRKPRYTWKEPRSHSSAQAELTANSKSAHVM